jgi:entericidin B
MHGFSACPAAVSAVGTFGAPARYAGSSPTEISMRLPFVVLSLIGLFALAACETVEGAGRDLQRAGSAVTGEAQEAQSGM